MELRRTNYGDPIIVRGVSLPEVAPSSLTRDDASDQDRPEHDGPSLVLRHDFGWFPGIRRTRGLSACSLFYFAAGALLG